MGALTNKQFSNFSGTQQAYWYINTPFGNGFYVPSGGETIDAVDSNQQFCIVRAKPIARCNTFSLTQVATLLDLKGRIPDITVAFDGANVGPASSYAGQFAFIKSSGGGYNEGNIIYSDGTQWIKIPVPDVCSTITTDISIDCATQPDLEDQCLYAWNNNWWEIRGRSDPDVGLRLIKILNVGTTNKSSSATIANGEPIVGVRVRVKQAYDSGASITVKVGSNTLMSSSLGEISPLYPNLYTKEVYDSLTLANPTAVTVEIGGSPSAGNCDVYVICGVGEL